MDVKSAARTLDLFELFARRQTPLSLSELSQALKAPASSCFNIVRCLQRRGYLYASQGKEIYPTGRLLDVATAFAAGDSWLERIEPALLRLRDRTGETIILGQRQRDRIVYLRVIEGPQTIRYTATAGDLKPLHSSAIGKAVLAALDHAALRDLLGELKLVQVTESTITDPVRLLADLERGRSQGFFVTSGENVSDVVGLAATFYRDDEVYGVAIAGPMHRMKKNLRRHASRLKGACNDIAHLLRPRAVSQNSRGSVSIRDTRRTSQPKRSRSR